MVGKNFGHSCYGGCPLSIKPFQYGWLCCPCQCFESEYDAWYDIQYCDWRVMQSSLHCSIYCTILQMFSPVVKQNHTVDVWNMFTFSHINAYSPCIPYMRYFCHFKDYSSPANVHSCSVNRPPIDSVARVRWLTLLSDWSSTLEPSPSYWPPQHSQTKNKICVYKGFQNKLKF